MLGDQRNSAIRVIRGENGSEDWPQRGAEVTKRRRHSEPRTSAHGTHGKHGRLSRIFYYGWQGWTQMGTVARKARTVGGGRWRAGTHSGRFDGGRWAV